MSVLNLYIFFLETITTYLKKINIELSRSELSNPGKDNDLIYYISRVFTSGEPLTFFILLLSIINFKN